MAIVVAGLLVALIGLGAYVIDVGALFEERRDLQNGADAAALAIAEDCLIDGRCTATQAQPEAERLASLNSNDGQATVNVADIDFNTAARTVTVTARTRDASDGDGEIDFVLASALGEDSKAVSAQATVAWGVPSGLTTLPIIISSCEWDNATQGGTIFGLETTLFFHNTSSIDLLCEDGPGFDIDEDGDRNEGGFGFLDSASDCSVTVQQGDTVVGQPGNGNPGRLGCEPSDLINQQVLLPIFDDIPESGSFCIGAPSGQPCYHVYGFAAFEITGFNFSGGQWRQPRPPPCRGALRCMRGSFVRFVSFDDVQIGDDATPNLGVTYVALSG